MCNAGVPETAQHFFFHCEKYAVERLDLINSLLNSPTIYSNLKELNAKNLLSGIPEITSKDNEALSDLVIKYLNSTGRFD